MKNTLSNTTELSVAALPDDAGRALSAYFSSQTPEWTTPQWLFDAIDKEFGFTLDLCSTHGNAKCNKHFTRDENGLLKSWSHEVVFMNPPYGDEIATWMSKAHDVTTRKESTVVCLTPSRTDTVCWHRFAMKHEIRFLRGRLKLGDGKNSVLFTSAIVVMRPASFSIQAFPELSANSKHHENSHRAES